MGSEITSDQVNHLCDLFDREIEELFQGLAVLASHYLSDGGGDTSGPHDLIDRDDWLSSVVEEPLVPLDAIGRVLIECLLSLIEE
jgi:hypothetical protein